MNIDEINNLSSEIFINNFKNIFEKTISIALSVEKKRPFKDKNDFIKHFMLEFDNLNIENKKKIIKNHPDLGSKFRVNNNLTEMSKKEQQKAGLDNCSNEEYLFFNKMNSEFKIKFGIPFIYAVKGANKLDIINEFKRRLKNNKVEKEIDESIKQVKNIAFFRLDEIIDE